MSDLLIRDIPDGLKRRLQEEASRHGRNLSEEAKIQIQKGISISGTSQVKAGDLLTSILAGGFFNIDEVQLIEESRSNLDRSPPDLR